MSRKREIRSLVAIHEAKPDAGIVSGSVASNRAELSLNPAGDLATDGVSETAGNV